MINPQNRNLSELNTCFFSSFDRLPHRVSHINFNLYHYAGNNPVKYLDPDGRITRDEYAYQLRTEGYEYKASIIEKQAAKDNQGFNIRIFKEVRDVFSIEVKVGLGLDLEVIENIGIDLGSLQGIISSSGFNENFTVGIGYGLVSLSNSASTDTDRAMIYELPENGNMCVSIGPFTYSMEDGFDFELSVGFQVVVGLYFHFSGKEFLDLVMKVEDKKHEY